MRLTWDKYEEAKFFLDKMRSSEGNDRQFRYYLSAFLSAGRSITFTLQGECSNGQHSEAFQEWYSNGSNSVQSELTDDKICSLILNSRNLVIHEGEPLTIRSLLIETQESPTTLEILQDWDIPAPEITFRARGIVIGAAVGYAWKITKQDGDLHVLSKRDGMWTAIFGLNNTDIEPSEVSCYYDFSGSDVTIYSVLCEICEEYLKQMRPLLEEWRRYIQGEISRKKLLSSD